MGDTGGGGGAERAAEGTRLPIGRAAAGGAGGGEGEDADEGEKSAKSAEGETGSGASPSRRIVSSRLEVYLTPLNSMQSFVDALHFGLGVAASAVGPLKGKTFSTSLFFQYYEQYLVIAHILLTLFLIALACTFVACMAYLFDFWAGMCMLLVVSMIMLDVVGLLYWWGIGLNSTTATNIICGVGLAIEFCIHLIRYFSSSAESGLTREQVLYSSAASAYPAHVLL